MINLQTDLENLYFQVKQHNYRLEALEKLHNTINLQTRRTGNEITLLREGKGLLHDTDNKIQSQIKYLKRCYSFFSF